ncbi:MAG: hypothetical protein HKO62_05940 [Gammaproteobacteria bacterium]|nr:hypothetical protein [Gammaproteobacteria bacterium]
MRIIPVLDIASGAIVHARGGDRARYRPVSTAVVDGRRPGALLAVLKQTYRFDTVYVADLDAIAGTGENNALIDKLAEQYAGLNIWLDCGPAGFPFSDARFRRVLGSEYGASPRLVMPELDEPDSWILSLDYRHGRLAGSTDFVTPEQWPHTVIVLDLDRVGSGNGAGQRHLEVMAATAAPHCWIVGGGISSSEELRRLDRDGVQAALVASILYSGGLAEAGFARKKMPRTGRGI